MTDASKTPRTDEAYVLRLLDRIADLEALLKQYQSEMPEEGK